MQFTDEQQSIIDSYKTKPEHILCSAVAGSGKTFTAIQLARTILKEHPGAHILYLVYNKAMQEEAMSKFADLDNVTVQTAHSFAYTIWRRTIGNFEAQNRLYSEDIKKVLWNSKNPSVKYAKHRIIHELHDLWTSKTWGLDFFEKCIKEKYEKECNTYSIPTKRGTRHETGYKLKNGSIMNLGHLKAFRQIIENNLKEKKYTHAMYLKAASMLKELPCFKYNFIIFDEAQDANRFMLDIVLKLPAKKKYFIGDERQAIYGFNGCINAFEEVEGVKYELTQSFRFGQEIADITEKMNGIYITGTKQPEKDVDINQKTVLFRTNAGILEYAINLVSSCKEHVHINYMNSDGNLSNSRNMCKSQNLRETQKDALYFFLTMLLDDGRIDDANKLCALFEDADFKIKWTPMFEPITNMQKDYEKDNGTKPTLARCMVILKGSIDAELSRFHNIYDRCGSELVNTFQKLIEAENMPASKNVLLCTAHKSKGLEWDYVEIADDYTLVDDQGKKTMNFQQEMNLLYVACTRGRYIVDARALKNELNRANIQMYDSDLFVNVSGKELPQEERISSLTHEVSIEIDTCTEAPQQPVLQPIRGYNYMGDSDRDKQECTGLYDPLRACADEDVMFDVYSMVQYDGCGGIIP